MHNIYKYPGHKVTTKGNKLQLDKKGDGGYCAWPPTLYKSGGRYVVSCPAPIMDAPEGYFEYIDARINAANAADAAARKAENATSPDTGVQRRPPRPSIANRPKGYIDTSDTQPPPEFSVDEVAKLRSALNYISSTIGMCGLTLATRFNGSSCMDGRRSRASGFGTNGQARVRAIPGKSRCTNGTRSSPIRLASVAFTVSQKTPDGRMEKLYEHACRDV